MHSDSSREATYNSKHPGFMYKKAICSLRMTVEVVGHGFLGSSKLLIFLSLFSQILIS